MRPMKRLLYLLPFIPTLACAPSSPPSAPSQAPTASVAPPPPSPSPTHASTEKLDTQSYCATLEHVGEAVRAARMSVVRGDLTSKLDEVNRTLAPSFVREMSLEVASRDGRTLEDLDAFAREHPDDARPCQERLEATLQRPLFPARPAPTTTLPALPWRSDVDQAMRDAHTQHRAVLLSFRAAWCGACAELDKTLADPAVASELTAHYQLIQVDATDDEDAAVKAIEAKYRVVGLPTIIVFDAAGREKKRILQYENAPAVLPVLRETAAAKK
jgi:thiol-disulfide isomerase/thioredoxin